VCTPLGRNSSTRLPFAIKIDESLGKTGMWREAAVLEINTNETNKSRRKEHEARGKGKIIRTKGHEKMVKDIRDEETIQETRGERREL
jgi:hypothetical protein